jgi:uncharacterized paraquat-inducible protein A
MKSDIVRTVATLGIWVTGAAVAMTALIGMMLGTRVIWQTPRQRESGDAHLK